MTGLSQNWITEGHIDFEYKKYMLLAYLQDVKDSFAGGKLYPYLGDLVFHYQNLLQFKESKELIFSKFPKELSKADFERLQLVYKEIIEDDEIIKEIQDIINFALPELKKHLDEGKDIYEFFEQNMHISPIGIASLNHNEGYFIMVAPPDKDMARIYEYQITIFDRSDERYRAIKTNYLESVKKNISKTYESIKMDIVRKYRKMANPATYLIECEVSCPLQESYLPIAKRMLVKTIG